MWIERRTDLQTRETEKYRQTERQTRGFICKTGRYIEYEIYIYTEFEKD